MAADNLLRLGSLGLLFGYPCVLDDLGEHPGSVCSGEEVSLAELSQGRSLEGWWTLVEAGKKDRSSWDWPHLQIDKEDRPRALIFEDPTVFDARTQVERDFTFGCQNYLDYPLVPGTENRAPARGRATISDSSCGGTEYRVGAGTRRALIVVQRPSELLCLEYRTLRERDDLQDGEEEMEMFQKFCFGYDPAEDRMIVSYTGRSKRSWTHYYERRENPKNDLSSRGGSEEARGNTRRGRIGPCR